jgi:hypothetical protein
MCDKLAQKIKDCICKRFGHFPDMGKKWKSSEHERAFCQCCQNQVVKINGKWS